MSGSTITRIALAIALLAVPGTSLAGDLRGDADRAGRSLAAEASGGKTPMKPGYLWTGVGLLGAATHLAVLTKLNDCPGSDLQCDDWRTRARYGALGLATAGVAVLIVGEVKREPLPSLTFDRGRVLLQSRVSF
jgi:hypothetical protein